MGLVGLSATQICDGEQTHARGRKPTLEGTSGAPTPDSGGEQAPARGRKHAALELDGRVLDGARCGEISGARSMEASLPEFGPGRSRWGWRCGRTWWWACSAGVKDQ